MHMRAHAPSLMHHLHLAHLTSVKLSLAGLAISFTKQSATGCAFSLKRVATLCRISARLKRGVLAQIFCASFATLKTSFTSSCVHAASEAAESKSKLSWSPPLILNFCIGMQIGSTLTLHRIGCLRCAGVQIGKSLAALRLSPLSVAIPFQCS